MRALVATLLCCASLVCVAARGDEARAADGALAGYVGRDSCRECHEGNFANFTRTGMGRSFHVMSADNIVEDFTGNNEFIDPRSGLHYRMFERDGRFFQRQFLLDSAGREIAGDEYALSYVVGSNNHSRGYIVEREGKLFQAPVCWDPTKKFWMFCPGYEYENENFRRETSTSCLYCHNDRVELVEGERNRYREPLALGIGCERCHGPGQEHVAYRKNPPDPWGDPGQPDPTTVNPARLPPEQRREVCFQCHLGDTSATVRVLRHDRSAEEFRPGMRITDIFVPFRYEQQTVSSFSLVSQADRMILSRCYLESGGKLECLTCHNPHIPVYEKPREEFRNNCGTCHDGDACAGTDEARAKTVPPDDCVACHMRRAEPNDRRYALFTDHWIRRDALNTKPDRRTRFELEPIFPDVYSSYPEGQRAYYLGRAHFLKALGESPTVSRWHSTRAVEAFLAAIDKQFGVSETWFYLGKSYMFLQRHDETLAALRRALEMNPAYDDAAYAAAQTLVSLDRHEEAAGFLAGILERDPGHALALAEIGRVHWSAGRYDKALEFYRRAVDRESWNPEFRLNLGMTLASLGRMSEAADAGLEAARFDPDNPAIWDFLRNAGREAGRKTLQDEAIRQLERLRSARP